MADSQKNIFHTKCLVEGKLGLVAIDGGSCSNIVSARMVEKLNLSTTSHPRPYELHWLNEKGKLEVNRQGRIKFCLGRYEDEVVCDVASIKTCHLLLGRPWHYDNKAVQDGVTNKISFKYHDKKIVLKPMLPSQVCEDQQTLKLKIEIERKEKEEIERERREKEVKEKEEKRREEKRREEIEIEKEREKMSKEILNSNVISSFVCDTILQGKEDVIVNEAHHKLPCLRKNHIDIIPSAPLYIHTAIETQPQEDIEDKHMKSFDFEVGLLLFEKEILQVYLERRISFDHGVWVRRSERKTSLMHTERTTKSEFLQVVFDPGGWVCSSQFQVNKALDSRTNLLEGGNDE